MNDSQFDDFFNDKLRDLAAPVPKGLWEKVSEGQFDQFVGGKLREAEAPVPDGLWEKVADAQFDNFIGDKLFDTEAAVPAGLWDKITDGQFDNFVGDKLFGTEAAVPAGLWDKITDGQFDNFVGDKLRDHASPIPAGLWEKVRPDEDDDRVGFFWFRYPALAAVLIGLLLTGAIGGYIYFNSQKRSTTENANSITPQKNNSDNNNKISTDNNKAATPVSPKAGDNTTVVPPVANDQKANPSAVDQQASHLPANAATQETSNNSTDHLKNGTTDKANGGQLFSASRNHSPARTHLDLRPPANASNNSDVTNNPYDILKNSAITGVTSTDKSSASNEEEIESYQASHLTGFTIPSGLGNFNGMMRDLSDKQLSTLNHTNQFKNVIICPTSGGGNPDWFLEVYASPNMAFKSVKNISASQLYLAKKDSSETMQIGYSGGVRLVKPINNNFLLKAGVEYTQANEKYVYRTENEVKTTTVVTVRTIIRAPGDTVIVQDTSVLQTIGFRNNTVKNRYRSFDIPVTVGYQFGDEDLKFGINAGVVMNISSWYEGVILDSSLATVPLTKSNNMVYKSNIGLGLIGSFGVVKRLSDDMHIFFEPYFRYNLSNMTTSQSSFSQRFSLGGLAIGLRFNLNRK